MNPVGCGAQALADQLADTAFGQLRDLVLEAVGYVFASMSTMWTAVP
ncbi:MAG: hypothetical protein HGA44_22885, partial [Cellulomonadaceae bacterium]|nr:hypothetical protein [Cellulomonadaceae bacterium]